MTKWERCQQTEKHNVYVILEVNASAGENDASGSNFNRNFWHSVCLQMFGKNDWKSRSRKFAEILFGTGKPMPVLVLVYIFLN